MEVRHLRGEARDVGLDLQWGVVVEELSASQIDLEEHVKEALAGQRVPGVLGDRPQGGRDDATLPLTGPQRDGPVRETHRYDLGVDDIEVSVNLPGSREGGRMIEGSGWADCL